MFAARPRSPRRSVLISLGVLVLLGGVWLGGHPGWLPAPLRSAFVDDSSQGRLTDQVLNLLARDYYRPIDRNQLLDKGLAAAIASLNDPYSHYFDPSDYRSFQSESNPHLSGIGIDVEPETQGLRIVDVFPESPAARAGLVRDDVIVKVGSTSLSRRSAGFSASLIKGRPGTRVTLTVLQGSRTVVLSLVRADIVVPVASGELVTYGGVKIGDLQLTSFTEGAGAELRSQVNRVLHAGARALILDMRENGGGLLDEAVNVASIFIPDGTVVSTAGRNQPRQVYLAKGGAISTAIPMVVLVDHGTASAAEIVTGALQDRDRAKVVGTRTYGKGVFQEIQQLPNGGALDITVGEYFTPSGRNLGGGGVREGAGVAPNVYALSDSRSAQDHALTVAEQTVAAQAR
ncbi:MAG: S41 family peptidase [Solirubrobacterales bacterium]|nr:S41 family peptidase [Solirubrobacterales bacterium]